MDEDNIKMSGKETECGAWTGLIWSRMGTSGCLLWIRWRTFGFH